MVTLLSTVLPAVVGLVIVLVILSKTIIQIGADEMGVVVKKWSISGKKLAGGNVIALDGEPGYQDRLLRPGLHFVNPIFCSVKRYPIPIVPPGTVGLVYAQVGEELPVGAKTAVYKAEFGKFTDVRAFMTRGGQKGIQRPVLQSGESVFVHPVGFLVVTQAAIYGEPISSEFHGKKAISLESFGLEPEDLELVVIGPEEREVEVIVAVESEEVIITEKDGEKTTSTRPMTKMVKQKETRLIDMIGVVETQDGPPVEAGQIACRIGGFDDLRTLEQSLITAMQSAGTAVSSADVKALTEASGVKLDDAAEQFLQQLLSRREGNSKLIALLLASKNGAHNSYQDFQAFLDAGGRMGVQHDPLLPGTYALNPIAVNVRTEPMLVVNQAEVMVIKSSLGLPTEDTSGRNFKHGSLVRPGHIGVWEIALGTGKYPLNPVVYTPIDVKTMVLNLSWAAEQSLAHSLDHRLSTIHARSKEGFEFSIDLQVQIHVPDVMAPLVICMVETMPNLVSDILHPAVGNHFRDKLQGMKAIDFIETREEVQKAALDHIRSSLRTYFVEVLGVYIQDVIPPEDLVLIRKDREKAVQNEETFKAQAKAEEKRAEFQAAKGNADKRAELAGSLVEVELKGNLASARRKEGEGEASYIEQTGRAKGAEVEAVNMALAKAIVEQVKALGSEGTTAVNVARAIASGNFRLVPDVLVTGGNSSNSSTADGILGLVTRQLLQGVAPTAPAKTPTDTTTDVMAPAAGAEPPTV